MADAMRHNSQEALKSVCTENPLRFEPGLRIPKMNIGDEVVVLHVVGYSQQTNALIFSEKCPDGIPTTSPFQQYDHFVLLRDPIDPVEDSKSACATKVLELLKMHLHTDFDFILQSTGKTSWYALTGC